MLLCVLGFQFVVFQSVLKRVVVAIFGAAAFFQLFVYTYGGQLLMDRSTKVAENLYQADKDLIIIIMRAQKSAVIKSGFYHASSETLTSILSAAGSLITLLKSFTE
jgi:7tm Odorant receptor